MTSKEFIEWQMLDCSYNQKKYYNQVLKDLKILEILKEYLTPHILEELCIEEKEVWEWLENDK